jgi:large subunit ribosomal protein L18
MSEKISSFSKRQNRIRHQLSKVATLPYRLSIYRSNTAIYAQVIEMKSGNVLASASSRDEAFKGTKKSLNVEVAKNVGELIAQRAISKNITKVYFDRGGYKYHGRVNSLADGARAAGLSF